MTRNANFRALSRREFLGAAGAAAGGLILAGCSSGSTASSATTAAGGGAASGIPMTTKSSVTLGYNNPNGVLRAPIFVGQTMGYFEEVGITSIEVNDADEYIGPLITNSFDIALVDADVMYAFNDSENPDESVGLKIIGVNQGSQPLIMIGNEGITGDGLAGLKVGGARAGSVNEAISKFILAELGYDWETDVEFTNLTGGSNDWVTAMLSNQIDATVAFSRHIPLAEEAGGGALFQEFLSAPQAGFAVTEATRNDFPNFSAAWNHAWIKSQRFCKTLANKDEVARILLDEWEIEIPPNNLSVYDLDAQIMTADNGFDPAEMDSWMDFIGPFTDLTDGVNDRWRGYFDVSGLHVAQAALDLPANPAADLSSGTTTTAPL